MAGAADRPVEPGTVIRYSYLWADEAARGREEGRKDRPSLVIAVAIQATHGTFRVLVLAVTHTTPREADDAVRLPARVKRALGLDHAPAWIVTTEANAFTWPGPDLRSIRGRTSRTVVYGRVPTRVLRDAVRSYLANRHRQRGRVVARTS